MLTRLFDLNAETECEHPSSPQGPPPHHFFLFLNQLFFNQVKYLLLQTHLRLLVTIDYSNMFPCVVLYKSM